MKTAYFDCFSGASGDMILGAMLDAGLAVERLMGDLEKLYLPHFGIDQQKVRKMGIGGSQAVLDIDPDHHGHHHRRLTDILQILNQSDLDEALKEKSAAIFGRLAQAEASVHHQPIESIHFHEVGAMDAIIDVVGAVVGLEALGVETIICSPLNLGGGMVACAHGVLPVPAPATAELVRNIPVYANGAPGELLTPTGAAILTTLSSRFGPLPEITIQRIGYGAGQSEREIPNLLRLIIGDAVR